MAKDPVCGMNIGENSQLQSAYAGKTYHFCSASCKAKFDQAPERYAEQAGGAGQQTGHNHRCC